MRRLWFTAGLLLLLSAPVLPWTDTITTSTQIRKVHIEELRTAINNKRANFAMSAYSFTDPTLSTSIKIRYMHITELRAAISGLDSTYNSVCSGVVPAAPSFTDPGLAAGTLIRTAHITELRSASDAVGTCASCCAQTCKSGACTGAGCANSGSGAEGNEGGGSACSTCYDCNGSGSCTAVAGYDVGCTGPVGCGNYACCGNPSCNGAGTCNPNNLAYPSWCQTAVTTPNAGQGCMVCDGSGGCSWQYGCVGWYCVQGPGCTNSTIGGNFCFCGSTGYGGWGCDSTTAIGGCY